MQNINIQDFTKEELEVLDFAIWVHSLERDESYQERMTQYDKETRWQM